MRPIYNILTKNKQFCWTRDCQIAFDKIKELIISNNVLVHFNTNYSIILSTDASNDGIAGCLSHKMADGRERLISFISRTYVPAENNYSVTDKEALAINGRLKNYFNIYRTKLLLLELIINQSLGF